MNKNYQLVKCLSIVHRSTLLHSFIYKNNCIFNSKTENESVSKINNSNDTYNEKDVDKINLLLSKARIIQDKITLGTINQKEKRNFTTIINNLLKLKIFDYELSEKLLDQIRWKKNMSSSLQYYLIVYLYEYLTRLFVDISV